METGIIYSKKYYKTDAKYFSMDKIGLSMPPGMRVMNVDGSSSVVEWPVHARFNFKQKQGRELFVSSGISSFIITNESNAYHTMMNGSESMMYKDYKKDKMFFAASIDLSVGYQQKLGNKNQVRIEPYIQIPVRGIGMGNVPVTGAGIHFGITRSR